ncbi:hypothetical protein [Actinacidiphila sp. ITFR-21]|uniref:hypothetical protein n=1 Tax=Actinacidiphila sp. ITFR-21 TaxID=3075199 RepID=UPI0028894153|nr:hypothetical protein [Streptomyces sp. ITFR-21]WNI17666.1 hypothetical protein RLT57_20465 [Streptomyces sp. ITFR-21]WNI17806.1 hypothetical protein RLT57_21180 [Streptomyces sp. ITFR-21]
MSKAKKLARATARPLTVSRMEGRTARPEIAKRLKSEQQNGTNVPARVVERMGGGTTGVRITDGESVARIRPKRKARSLGSEATAAGIVGRGYGSKGDGIKRLTDAQIRGNRDAYFASAASNRKAQKATPAAPDASDVGRIAGARADYEHAIGQSRACAAVGDDSGAEAWMKKARECRRIFRNK